MHIPFCRSKCPYCDFYSMRGTEDEQNAYLQALKDRIAEASARFSCKADTLYIGGGTPSLLGAKRIADLVEFARKKMVSDDAEITVECNPYGLEADFMRVLNSCGVNRISIGMQSAVDEERRILGRSADAKAVESLVKSTVSAEIDNISLDVMLGIPKQNSKSLAQTLRFCGSLPLTHISAYMLKLEPGTYFYKNQDKLALPDEDEVCDMYLQLCEYMTSIGTLQYEISNFARSGFESRHNLKYWHCEEYLGLGPAAHSFLDGKRFYFPRDIQAFIQGGAPLFESDGGDFTEYAMLALRLTEGLREDKTLRRFGHPIPAELLEKAKPFVSHGLMEADESGLKFTRNGFLLSNSVLAEIL